MSEDARRFLHDCSSCAFLGQFEKYDLYWCTSPSGPTFASLIARYSSDGPDYISHHPPGAYAHKLPERAWYTEILKRAQERGLYDPAVAGYKKSDEPLHPVMERMLKALGHER